ncbi:MAG: hypothetical protein V1663_04450 [archaeon]
MKKIFLNLSKEVKTLLLAVIVLTLIFAFNDNKPSFILSNWLSNLFLVLFLVIITLLFHIAGVKLAANYFDQEARFKFWHIKQFYFTEKRHLPLPFPIGIIIALFFTLISNGTSFFTAITTFEISNKKRIGRSFPNISEKEIAFICFWGIFANLVLLMFFKFINIPQGVLINSWFIIWNLLPITDLMGSQMFFSYRILYLFFLFFIIIFLLLISFISLPFTLVISILISIVLIIIYFYFREYPKPK